MEVKEALKQNKEISKRLSFQELKSKGLLPTKIQSQKIAEEKNENQNTNNLPFPHTWKPSNWEDFDLLERNINPKEVLEENMFDSSLSSNSEDGSGSSSDSEEEPMQMMY